MPAAVASNWRRQGSREAAPPRGLPKTPGTPVPRSQIARERNHKDAGTERSQKSAQTICR
jgi:hypothetical protein